MFIIIIQLVAVLLTLIFVKFFAWELTEKTGLPDWLDYKPYNCRLCLGWWTQMLIYSTFGALLVLPVYMYVGWIIATLDAIAYYIHIKKNTESIYDQKPETPFVPAPSLEDAKFTRLYLAPIDTEEWRELNVEGEYSDLLVETNECLYRQHLIKIYNKDAQIEPFKRYKAVVVNAAGEYIMLGKNVGLSATLYTTRIGFTDENYRYELITNEIGEAQQLTDEEIKALKENINNGNK